MNIFHGMRSGMHARSSSSLVLDLPDRIIEALGSAAGPSELTDIHLIDRLADNHFGNSRREAARIFGLSRETILKMCRFSLPPGYTRTKPVTKPKLGVLPPVIDAILESDQTGPVKQRHTAKRIFDPP